MLKATKKSSIESTADCWSASNGIVAYSGYDWVSYGINVMTAGIPAMGVSHVGILHDGVLYESTAKVGVESYSPVQRVSSYRGKAWLYPLYRPLYSHETKRITRHLRDIVGRPYDLSGIVAAGGVLWSRAASWIVPQSLSALFCSELVASAYQVAGILPGNASCFSPNRLVRSMRRSGLLLPSLRLQ